MGLIQLPASQGSIQLLKVPHRLGYELRLELAGETTVLGGEAPSRLNKWMRRLGKRDALESKTNIAGKPVVWLISLSDGHTTLFCTKEGPVQVFILLKDAEIHDYFVLDLSDDQVQSWLDLIDALH